MIIHVVHMLDIHHTKLMNICEDVSLIDRVINIVNTSLLPIASYPNLRLLMLLLS